MPTKNNNTYSSSAESFLPSVPSSPPPYNSLFYFYSSSEYSTISFPLESPEEIPWFQRSELACLFGLSPGYGEDEEDFRMRIIPLLYCKKDRETNNLARTQKKHSTKPNIFKRSYRKLKSLGLGNPDGYKHFQTSQS